MTSPHASRTFEMNLQGRYFLLLASAREDIEVRVLYPKYRALAPGGFIRFSCENQARLTRVVRVVPHHSFEELLDAEDPARIDPDATREQQLLNLRQIYSPEKETLGVLAIFPRRSACRARRHVEGARPMCDRAPSTHRLAISASARPPSVRLQVARQFDAAGENLGQARDEADRLDAIDFRVAARVNLAILFNNTSRHPEAESAAREALDLLDADRHIALLADAEQELGRALRGQAQLAEAAEAGRCTVQAALRCGSRTHQAMSLISLAETHSAAAEHGEAGKCSRAQPTSRWPPGMHSLPRNSA